MKLCCVIGALFLVAGFSYSQGMTIHLLDIAAQQSSIEDGSLLTRIFLSKNITGRILYTPELDGTSEKILSLRNSIKKNDSESSEEEPSTENDESDIDEVFDSWSIVWYIASFSGLILFFLIVSCSEWCCRNRIRRQQQQQQQQQQQSTQTQASDIRVIATRSQPEQQPPPSYDQFAPPSYDSLLDTVAIASAGTGTKKTEYEVYVVPVHTMTTMMSAVAESASASAEEAPPSYAVLNMQPPTAPIAPQGQSALAPRC